MAGKIKLVVSPYRSELVLNEEGKKKISFQKRKSFYYPTLSGKYKVKLPFFNTYFVCNEVNFFYMDFFLFGMYT